MSKKKKIFQARSKENGITFYSQKVPSLCYDVTRDEDGEIKVNILPEVISEGMDYGCIIPKRHANIKLELLIAITGIILTLITRYLPIALGVMYFVIWDFDEISAFATLVYNIKFGKLKALGRYHSAEHMATKAYEKYQRQPSIEEIKKESRYDQACGSRFAIGRVLLRTISTVLIFLCEIISLKAILILILVELLMIVNIRYNFLKWLQILITNKPTDKELELASEGLKIFNEFEENVISSNNMFILKVEKATK